MKSKGYLQVRCIPCSFSDSEQQELIEASRVIQNTLRRHRDRSHLTQEKHAVLLIENCYRQCKEVLSNGRRFSLGDDLTTNLTQSRSEAVNQLFQLIKTGALQYRYVSSI